MLVNLFLINLVDNQFPSSKNIYGKRFNTDRSCTVERYGKQSNFI